MKKLFLFLAMISISMSVVSCDKNSLDDLGSGTVQPDENTKILIVYYSWSGITKSVAERMQRTLRCDIFEIVPAAPYPSDSYETHYRAVEERKPGKLPKLAGKLPDLTSYDVILLGGPVWSDYIATPLASYIQQSDFTGKKVAGFWTDAGTPGHYKADFSERVQAGNATLLEGLGLSHVRSMGADKLDRRLNTWFKSILTSK